MLDIPELDPASLSEHAAANRKDWNADSDTYQSDHGPQLAASGGLAWGVWQIPEAELQDAGRSAGQGHTRAWVAGRRNGPSRWPRQARGRWALDLSEKQLEHARRLMQEAGVDFPLVHASAEAVPLPDRSFDIVFCDYGAMTFADPYVTVPEAARLLRPEGMLVFCGATPVIEMCYPEDGDNPQDRLLYWTTSACGRCRTTTTSSSCCLTAPGYACSGPTGSPSKTWWSCGPRPDAVSSYRDETDREWYRRWPGEQIWKVRRED